MERGDRVRWQRHHFVTPGADPTEVVEWRAVHPEDGRVLFVLVEFQGVVVRQRVADSVTRNLPGYTGVLETELHKALEAAHAAEEEAEAARRDAAGDPDAHIYGEP